ncbi:NRAMP family divalent metal transporter [Alicyclobacillus sendaiensis]|uniref:Divalent metal cation transporter n=1 Tax=Alicyclobacillus sendaiensis PA2 TaxID=3029425 RepID=A0ABT6XW55_ALISE|nr:divalent metal cation transporter [Alicyclobacillus sendaiensis]MDI9259237.1 divalent metal cation transporter [Alicyclobacillus sendaiensis PA2]
MGQTDILQAEVPRAARSFWWRLLATVGPGVIVMLANTDAGCIITAAQSGAEWGYAMVLPQLVLIPIVYLVQEVTVRLGLVTGRGHGELIRQHFGRGWAWISVSTLFLSAIGALVTEFAGIAGVGELFGISPYYTVSTATVLLIALALTGSYRRVERVGIAMGLFELALVPGALLAHPSWPQLLRGLATVPLNHPSYVYLLAANVGAVIMPWMIFYQQSAVVDRKLTLRDLRFARWDTFLGSILTQVIMIAVVVMIAATVGRTHPNSSLETVGDIAQGLTPFLGAAAAKVIFGLGMLGASFVAALVVSLAGAWGIGEVTGIRHSLNTRWKDAKAFYTVYSMAHIGGALLVFSGVNLINLSVDTEVMNSLLLPIVLGFLLLLERRALPPEHRMRGWYRAVVTGLSFIVMAFGVYMGLQLVI